MVLWRSPTPTPTAEPVQALVTHFKSKLLTFPGFTPDRPRFDTRDEGERARFGLYALNQRAAEAATVRAWATERWKMRVSSAG